MKERLPRKLKKKLRDLKDIHTTVHGGITYHYKKIAIFNIPPKHNGKETNN
jgi:hypothetical protein